MPAVACDYSVAGDVAILSVRHPPVNALSSRVFECITKALQRAEQDAAVNAIVLCGDSSTFPAGADITEFPMLKQAIKSGVDVPLLAQVPQLLESCNKLVVAAIHGTALGGGLEIALGCHFRIALESARFGLPEVLLGLIPGAGGTQRLPRLIGVPSALQLITTGTHWPAFKALKAGLVDFVLPKHAKTRDSLVEAAILFASETAKGGIDLNTRRLSNWPCLPEMPQHVFDGSKQMANRSARGFIAPIAAIDAVEAAAKLSFKEGIEVEFNIFKKLLLSSQSKAQQHVFFAQKECSRVPGINEKLARQVKSIAIIGAGLMGGGVAMNFLQVGIPVFILETKQEYLDRGIATIRSNYEISMKRGKLKPSKMKQYMSLLTPTLNYSDIRNVDIVIEAVFEDMNVKKSVLRKLDEVCAPHTILCTNTSTLDVDEIASATKRPEKVIGTHFFSPANKMKLLENVRCKTSSNDTISTVMKLGKTIKKVTVLVGNCFGFVGNRIIEWYGRESAYMVEEGASVTQIDKALFKFGMPMGPFQMADLAGNDITMKIRKSLGLLDPSTRPRQERYHGAMGDMLCKMGRLGMKTGSGWYKYTKGSRGGIEDPIVNTMIDKHRKQLGIKIRSFNEQEIIERCVYPMINEGFKILEEGIACRSGDIDIVLIYGYGFPAYRGGPMHYADEIGLDKVVAVLERHGRAHQDVSHWKVSPLLQQLAQQHITLAKYQAMQRKSKL